MNTNTMLNRVVSVGRALLVCLPFFFGHAQAIGATYDGIYQWSPGNFLSLHQDGTNMIATIYFTKDGDFTFPATAGTGTLPVPTLDLFDLMHGEVTGSTAAMDGTRFHRACNVGYDFKFNVDSSITVTRIGVSNTPAANSAGISCSAILSAEATPLTVPKIRFGPNTAPVANAGSAQNVSTGTFITLDGSGSTDADGNALTYAWTLTTKPAGSAAALSSATSVKPTFTADVAGTYIASLTVSDGTANSSVATITVVAAAVNSDPIASYSGTYTCISSNLISTATVYAQMSSSQAIVDVSKLYTIPLSTMSVPFVQIDSQGYREYSNRAANTFPLQTAQFKPPSPGVYTLAIGYQANGYSYSQVVWACKK